MSKRKGYSQTKRAIRVADSVLKDLALIYTPEFEGAVLINPIKKYAIKPNPAVIKALHSTPHTWSIYLCAFGKNDDGIYMRGDEYAFKDRVFHYQIEEAIVTAHEALAKELGDEFHTVGYIASTRDWNWDEKKAFDLFTEIGGI